MARWQASRRTALVGAAAVARADAPVRAAAVGIVAEVGPANQVATPEPASALRYE